MNKEDEILQNRIRDLAGRCYNNNMYTFTDFLGLADAAAYYEIEKEVSYVRNFVWGGNDNSERVIVRFGSKEQLGYEEKFPISIIHVKPLMAKFADDFSHRDVLGSLMNLGIERAVLGDINLINNEVYVFCLESIAEYICENLTRIRHTSVMCEVVNALPQISSSSKETSTIMIQSERIDGIISKVCNISRSQCIVLFSEKKVFINGRQCTSNSALLKENDIVTVRGFGRFKYLGITGTTRKGKLNAQIEK